MVHFMNSPNRSAGMLPKKQTDEELVRQYINTNRNDLFEQLYNRYVNKVYRRCLSITKDPVVAEDYTQDIFIKAMQNLRGFREKSSFSTWLYTVSSNYCLDQVKHRQRLPTVSYHPEVAPDRQDTSDAQEMEEQIRAVNHTLTSLRDDELEVIRLKYYEGLEVKDIAARLGQTESAVKMRLKRTRDKLKKQLEDFRMN